jgi:hypothetical protein
MIHVPSHFFPKATQPSIHTSESELQGGIRTQKGGVGGGRGCAGGGSRLERSTARGASGAIPVGTDRGFLASC